MIVIPLVLLYQYRKRLELAQLIPGNFNKSILRSNIWIYSIGFFGIGMLVIIIINLLHKNTKTCVAEVTSMVSELIYPQEISIDKFHSFLS
jgi:hypothetical protein